MAAASRTAGCAYSTASTSDGYTLNPSTIIMSFFRWTIDVYPSSSMRATSPVWNHVRPSACLRRTFALSWGFFQYPFITCGPEMHSSPASPTGSSRVPVSTSTIFMSVSGNGNPIVPSLRNASCGVECVTGDVSDSP